MHLDKQFTEENFKLEDEINSLTQKLEALEDKNEELTRENKELADKNAELVNQSRKSPPKNHSPPICKTSFESIDGGRVLKCSTKSTNSRIRTPSIKKAKNKEELYSNSSILIARNKQLRDKIEDVIVSVARLILTDGEDGR